MITKLKVKYMEKKKVFITIFIAIFISSIAIISFIFNHLKNDGMEQSGIYNVYYRTYTNENGWSKWTKNGKTSGNVKKGYNVKKIELKVKNTKKGNAILYIYNDKKGWIQKSNAESEKEKTSINGIKITLIGNLYRKYDICYRTYNTKNSWLEWSCNGNINGNKTMDISSIQVKMIPKSVIMRDYLKDFSLNKNESQIGFEGGK